MTASAAAQRPADDDDAQETFTVPSLNAFLAEVRRIHDEELAETWWRGLATGALGAGLLAFVVFGMRGPW